MGSLKFIKKTYTKFRFKPYIIILISIYKKLSSYYKLKLSN